MFTYTLGYLLIVGHLSTNVVESCFRRIKPREKPQGCCDCTPEMYQCPGSCPPETYTADVPDTSCKIANASSSAAAIQRPGADAVFNTTAVIAYMDNCTTDLTDEANVVTCLPCPYGCLTCTGGGENNCTACRSGYKLSKTTTDHGKCDFDLQRFVSIIVGYLVGLMATAVVFVYCCVFCLAWCSRGCRRDFYKEEKCCLNYFGCGAYSSGCLRAMCESSSRCRENCTNLCDLRESCSQLRERLSNCTCTYTRIWRDTCLALCEDGCVESCGKCIPGRLQTCICTKNCCVCADQPDLQEQAIEFAPLPSECTTVCLEGRPHSAANVEIDMGADADDDTEPKLLLYLPHDVDENTQPNGLRDLPHDLNEITEPKHLPELPRYLEENTEPKLCYLPPHVKARADRLRRFQEEHFDFDIFVSYDSEDENWVRQHLMPEMEERLGLKLCIHERDFRLGKQILTNIYDCLKASRKVMLIFSTSFAESDWCQYELTLGQRHVMDFRDTLAVVVLEDIPGDALTTEMKAVVETTTYIKWPVNPEARDTFWRRLRANFVDILGIHEERTSTEQRQTENYTPDMEV